MDEMGKIIDVDFRKKKVNLTLEFERKSAKIEELKEKFRECLVLIDEATDNDRAYVNTAMMILGDMVGDIEIRRENAYKRRFD